MFSVNCGSVSAVNVLKCTILKIFIWRTDRWQCFLINMMTNQLHLASYLSNLASYLQEYYWWGTRLVRFWLVDNSANAWKNLPCFLRKVPRHGHHVRKVPVKWKKSHMCAHSVCSLAVKVPLPQKSTSCQGKFATNKNMMHLLASDWPISR